MGGQANFSGSGGEIPPVPPVPPTRGNPATRDHLQILLLMLSKFKQINYSIPPP